MNFTKSLDIILPLFIPIIGILGFVEIEILHAKRDLGIRWWVLAVWVMVATLHWCWVHFK